MLKEGLKKQGFAQSKIDPCLFIRKDAIIVAYIDDCLIFGQKENIISEIITNLQKDFKLTDEGLDVNAFLGIKVDRNVSTRTLTMMQPALIGRVLKKLALDGNNT